jgi:hypothetical protein
MKKNHVGGLVETVHDDWIRRPLITKGVDVDETLIERQELLHGIPAPVQEIKKLMGNTLDPWFEKLLISFYNEPQQENETQEIVVRGDTVTFNMGDISFTNSIGPNPGKESNNPTLQPSYDDLVDYD